MARLAGTVGRTAVVLSLLMVVRKLRENTGARIGETSRGLLAMLVEIDGWLVDRDFADGAGE